MPDAKTKIGSNEKSGRNGLKFLFRAGILLLLLLIVAYFIVTSSAFIQGVVIPRVEKTVNAKITVADVEFSPFTQLALHEVKITPEGREMLLSAKLIHARYSLLAILRGNILVEEVLLDAPTVSVVTNPDGSSNLDFLKSLSSSADTSRSQENSVDASGPTRLNIKSVALKNGTFRQTTTSKTGDKVVTELASLMVTASDIRNGGRGKLDFSGGLSLDKTTASPTAVASLQAMLGGSFTFDLTQDIIPGEARGAATFTVSRGTGEFADLNGLVAKLDCEVSPTEVKQLALRFDRGNKSLGEARVSGPFDSARQQGKLKLEILSIDRQVLNLFGAASGIDFVGTTVSAGCDVEFSKGGESIASNGRLEVARFQIKRQGQTTPELDLRCDYGVALDLASKTLQIKNVSLAVTQKSRALLQGELSNPMTLALGSNATNGTSEAVLTLALTDLNLADWKPFTGSDGPTGSVSAKVKLVTRPAGGQVVAQIESLVENLALGPGDQALRIGELSFNGVVTNQSPNLSVTAVMAARNISMPAVQGTPLEATLKLDASVAKSVAELRQCALQLTSTTRARNELSLKGTVDFSDTEAVTGKLALTADALDATRYYDLFDSKTQKAVAATPQTVTTNSVSANKDGGAVKLPLRNFIVEAAIGRFLLREVDVANFQTTIALDSRRVLLKPFQLTLNNAPITASVDVDMSEPGYKLDLTFDAKGVPIEPIANSFSPAQRGKAKGTASARIKLVTQPGDKQIAARIESLFENLALGLGDQILRIGEISINGGVTNQNQRQFVNADIATRNIFLPATQGTPLEAALKLEASIAKNVAELHQCGLRLTPTDRAANELSLVGSVDFSDMDAITGKLALTSAALDATRYYDLFDSNTQKAGDRNPQSATTNTVAASKEPDAVKLPFRNFVAEATIGRFYLREVDAANLQATLAVNGSRVLLKPFQLTLNNAPITATADVDLGMPGYKYDLSFNANGVPIEPLANSFSPDYRGKAQGRLIAGINVKGAGVTGANLRNTLAATADLNFTNANIQITGKSMKKVVGVISIALNAPELLSSPLDYVTTRIRAGEGKIEVSSFVAQSAVLHAESQGTIPITEVLMDSPLNQPVEVSLVRNLANKLSFANVPTNVPYMKLPDFVTIKGTLGNVDPKVDKTKLTGLTVLAVGAGVANIIGGKAGEQVGAAADLVSGLLGGKPADPGTNTTTTNQTKPVNILDLFKKPKK